MSPRPFLLSFLLVSFVFAADQATPAKADGNGQSQAITRPDESNPPAQTDSDPPAKSPSQGSGWRSHIHFGGVMIGAGYSRYSGGYPYGYGPGYWGDSLYYGHDPFLWSPFYHPGYYTGYRYGPNMGDVKIQAGDKTALVFLDGALAGPLEKLKDMWLKPGAYNLEVRSSARRFTGKIYVLSGKTLKVTPDMMVSEALQ